ncbi:MAG: Na(+)-translocating NADH-quinone reductase subunit C [Gammaproteobacteria bacterium]|nr:Na(+)-translocating NADH-quinone reductase subunit C [Gammaproteobacteria bacterium]NNJ77722.1 Na(+)-translocating NADH-quinone reductase subunit C [Xanthomonadales bacterium]
MAREGPIKAVVVVLLTALVCSSLVSGAVVLLRPIQLNNQLLDRSRNIMALTGLLPADRMVKDDEMLVLFKSLDARVVNVDTGQFTTELDPDTFDMRRAANDAELSTAVPASEDPAKLGRRSRYAPVYLVWDGYELDRLILPVRGAGMWSMLYGYIALQPDFTTIAGMTFYEQNETPGLGDQIAQPRWLSQWSGKQLLDDQGTPRFHVSEGKVEPGAVHAPFQVDGLTGATVTGNAVTNLVHYWFGPHGYQSLLQHLEAQPPRRGEDES